MNQSNAVRTLCGKIKWIILRIACIFSNSEQILSELSLGLTLIERKLLVSERIDRIVLAKQEESSCYTSFVTVCLVSLNHEEPVDNAGHCEPGEGAPANVIITLIVCLI